MRKIVVIESLNQELREQVGKALAEKMGLKCYGTELLSMAEKEFGVLAKYAEKYDETTQKKQPVFFRTPHARDLAGLSSMSQDSEEFAFQGITRALLQLIQKEDCVILGRASSYTLRDMSGVFRVCLTSEVKDSPYEKYYEYYTGAEWKYSTYFDVVIPTQGKTVEELVDKIQAFREIAWAEK